MNIRLLSYSDIEGGAARAAYRLHSALRTANYSSRMLVQKKLSDDHAVTGPVGYVEKLTFLNRILAGELLVKLQKSDNPIHHTPSWYPFELCRHFTHNLESADIVHLHWLRDIPTIKCICRINKPVVWTLHDMWAFCGAEHYTSDSSTARWRTGYTKSNRSPLDKGLDIDHWTWKRKKKYWQQPLHIIAPSHWLAKCVSESSLMRDWPVHVIPNVLDPDIFKPIDKSFARQTLNLPQDAQLILFGAIKGGEDPRKGFDLLQRSLAVLGKPLTTKIYGVIFGQSQPKDAPEYGFPIRWMGHIHDEWTMTLLYSAADVMVVPSYQEAFGQTASEAQACGCPVVAFDTTGLPDVVEHKKTGYLAAPFEPEDLAHGITWVLEDKERHKRLSVAARERTVRLWSPEVVVPQYISVYQQAIEQWFRMSTER